MEIIHKVILMPYGLKLKVLKNEKLIDIFNNADFHINASCGGNGVCGKCKIVIEKGQVDGGISQKLSSFEIKNNFRLACKSKVVQDVVIRVPVESMMGSRPYFEKLPIEVKSSMVYIDLSKLSNSEHFYKVVDKFFIKLPNPNIGEGLTDLSRITNCIRTSLGKYKLQIDLPVIRKFPRIIREKNFNITVALFNDISENGKTKLLDIQSGDKTNRNFAIAIDIGTTTICGELIDLNCGKILAENSVINLQASYGEDIISRIIYAKNYLGLKKLHKVIISCINNLIGNLLEISGIDIENISLLVLAGNTTMTHFFLKVNPTNIRLYPYTPVSNFYPPIIAKDINLKVNKNSLVIVYPGISSYVGGDIVSGVISSGMHLSSELTLFMDIGTNAEIVLGNKEWMLCAACSAGSAFEGGGVEFGMRAAPGAIENFYIDIKNSYSKLFIIGEGKPVGICGSGLIAIVAELLKNGIIDSVGKFNLELSNNRIRRRNTVYEYVLAWKDETKINKDITINEIDIDNLMRAKGAIFGGCISLLEQVGMSVSELDRIIIAGGFGSYVNLEKAMIIGLLPEFDYKKIFFLGNGSLSGAKMACYSSEIRKDVVELAKKITNCELSEIPSYMNNYVASLFFPHTDMNMFPNIAKKLKLI